jgi:TatD DNase family protein
MTGLIDTHSHIHFPHFAPDLDSVLERAQAAGVSRQVVVGVNEVDSAASLKFVKHHPQMMRAAVGLHPHDAAAGPAALATIAKLAADPLVVAIGECGLDQFKSKTTRDQQEAALRFQIELANQLEKPLIFHVRNAFADFWRILDDYPGTRGLVHCFSAGVPELEGSLARGLYIALGGIMTFTKDQGQLAAARQVPLAKIILETDCPFLAPPPHRGRRNEPAFLADTLALLAALRQEKPADLAQASTANAFELFGRW